MIDTIAVVFPTSPSKDQLEEWVGHPLLLPHQEPLQKYFQNEVINRDAPIKFTFYPSNPRYPEPHFRIEVSPTMALFGNNVEMIRGQEELDEAYCIINQGLAEIPWIPKVDFREGKLYRIDPAYNHAVGDRVPDYIKPLRNLTLPQRETRPWRYDGIQFYSQATTTKFYNKEKQSKNSSAWGYLRHEISIRYTGNIEKRLDIKEPTLKDLTIDWLDSVLQADLNRLHLDNTIICDRDLAADLLHRIYKPNKATRLYGYLLERQSMTREQMIGKGYKERTLRDWDKDIVEAGVALTMTDKVPLPPLIMDGKGAEICRRY